MRVTGLLLFSLLLLGGCGQKGPLFMPPPEATGEPPVARHASTQEEDGENH